MTLITTVVYNDEVALKHLPASAGDKIAGSLVQLSTDATQIMTIGSDGGLLVTGAETTFTPGGTPATTNDNTTPTTFFGGNTSALGTPEGFFTVDIGGQQKLVPFYAMP